jgi:hypothetical protein
MAVMARREARILIVDAGDRDGDSDVLAKPLKLDRVLNVVDHCC